MPQPVVLEHWPVGAAGADDAAAFTSIGGVAGAERARWSTRERRTGCGRTSSGKFAELPRCARASGSRWRSTSTRPRSRTSTLLARNGWSLVDPRPVAGTPEAYRAYVAGSQGGVHGAQAHVRRRRNSGLLSDRSVYYLASGRPVLAQDTGLSGLYPDGRGAADVLRRRTRRRRASRRSTRDYARHAQAARAIAEEYFDSDKVLTRLLRELNV